MNRSELRSLVESNIGRSDKTDLINSALDLALEEIVTLRDWTKLVREDVSLSTTANQAYVNLSADVSELWEVRLDRDTLSSEITLLPRLSFLEKIPKTDEYSVGIPTFGYLSYDSSASRILTLYPVPDAAYDILYTYVYRPNAFTGDGMENPLDLANGALVYWATSYVWEALESPSTAAVWDRKYEKAITRLVRADQRSGKLSRNIMPKKRVYAESDETYDKDTGVYTSRITW